MNRLNIAAFFHVETDFGIGRVLLQFRYQLTHEHLLPTATRTACAKFEDVQD